MSTIIVILLLSITSLCNGGGTWNGGTWNGGTWNGGTWNGGSWNGGSLNGGSWNGGSLNGGSWNAGSWNSGTWNGGSWNGGSWNGGSLNGGSWNGGTWNGGTWNGAPNDPVILTGITLESARQSLENSSIDDLHPFVELLPQLVRCALPLGSSWKVIVNDTEIIFNGVFGLAPSFDFIPLTSEQQPILTACILAQINYFGRNVEISIRNNPFAAALMDEMIEFSVYEGAFFGNIFMSNMTRYSCIGESNDTAWLESSDRQWRLCTEDEKCGFESLGKCSDACSTYTENYGYTYCTGKDGLMYPAMNVYLRKDYSSNGLRTTIFNIGLLLMIFTLMLLS